MISRSLTKDEIPYTINLHLRTLTDDFLPGLGESFLSILHQEFISSPLTITIGIFDKKLLLGFIVGSYDTSLFFKSVIQKHWLKFIPLLLIRCIRKPINIKFLWQSLFYGNNRKFSAEILIIIVCQKNRRRGVGSKLFFALLDKFKAQGIANFIVGTHAGNLISNNFYKKLKGKLMYSTFQFNKKWNYYLFTTSL